MQSLLQLSHSAILMNPFPVAHVAHLFATLKLVNCTAITNVKLFFTFFYMKNNVFSAVLPSTS